MSFNNRSFYSVRHPGFTATMHRRDFGWKEKINSVGQGQLEIVIFLSTRP